MIRPLSRLSVVAGWTAALALPVSLAAAPGSAGLELSAWLERAQEANPALEAAAARFNAAEARVPQARALPSPRLQATHFVESIQTRTGPQEQALSLSQRLPWFGTLDARGSAAEARAAALAYAWEDEQRLLAREVARQFFAYGYLGKSLALNRENLALLETLQPIAEERVRGGGPLEALVRLQVEITRLQDEIASREEERAAQSARIRALLALPMQPDPVPWPTWEAPEPAEINGRALSHQLDERHPALQRLDQQLAAARSNQRLARLQSFPDMSVGLNYIRIADSGNLSAANAGQDAWSIVVSLDIPLWFNANDAARQEARAETRALEAEQTDYRNRLRADLTSALTRHRDAQRRLALYGGELTELATQSAELTRSAYESGEVRMLELIDSERSLRQVRDRFWRAAADTWQARVDLRALVAQPLAGTMASPFNDE